MVEEAKTRSIEIPLAFIAVLLLSFSGPVDAWLSGLLCRGLGLNGVAADSALPSLIGGILTVAYAAIGFVCSCFLRSTARVITMLQLLVLSIVLSFPFYKELAIHFQPLAYVGALLLGISLGLSRAHLKDAAERAYSQQVEAVLRNRQLLETRLQMIKQDEVERKMLAADLHDQVLNDLKLLLRILAQNKDSLGAQSFSELNSRIDLAMENIRAVMESLCPSDLEHIGLLASLEECLKDRGEKHGFIAQYRSSIKEEEIGALNKIEKALLYRLVQESITNICKHAQASKVRLATEIKDGSLIIRIVDDGVGLKDGAVDGKSRGMQYMRLRSEIIGARINWSAGAEGKGTIVEIQINLAGRTASESPDS